MSLQPPKYALKFLRWFCREDFIDEIEGDLIEIYEDQASGNPNQAKWKFYRDVLFHFRPEYIRPIEGLNHLNDYGMFRNYIKIAWRSLLKQKLYSSINIGGLAVGLTCFILIFLYVQHELSYDRFYANDEQIYRVYQKMDDYAYRGKNKIAFTTVGLAPAMTEDFPEVEAATTIKNHEALLSYDDHHFYEPGIRADKHFFEVFPLTFIHGNPHTCLEADKSLVLTQTLAKKLFGAEDPIGKSIIYHNNHDFTVTGVIQDIPTHSSMKFTFLSPMESSGQYVREMKEDRWNNNDYYTFFTLNKDADPRALESKLPAFLKKHIQWEDDHPFKSNYLVQPLKDFHFENDMNFDFGLKGNAKYISLFSIISILVLLLACVNYMNLAITRSINRAGEVGVRKVIGATRRQLIWQFLGESVMISFLALIISLILAYYLSPIFGYILDRPIELNFLDNVSLIPWLLTLVLIVGIISGSYPALLMSSLKPVRVLKGKMEGKFSGVKLQRFLTIAQYAISISLIICSLVIYQQFQFIYNKELGYNKEQVVTVSVLDWGVREKIDELQAEWSADPRIRAFTTSAELPTDVTSGTLIRHIDESDEERMNIYRARVDYGYLDVFGIQLMAGRDFSKEIQSDRENAIIINETAAKAFGWTAEEAVGKQVHDHIERTIIGVVKDFHMHSMHMEIAPLMLEMRDQWFAFISLKLQAEDINHTLSYLEENMQSYSPYPFDYQFLDERFDQLYTADMKVGEIFGFFTILAILIASMGLFGLAAFTANQRSKEIGIRKVLGASVNSIVGMLSGNFLKMVVIGFTLAVPVAWYAMSQWLQEYVYRVELQWWLFALAGLFSFILAFLTIGFQAYQAATVNPVECLKDE